MPRRANWEKTKKNLFFLRKKKKRGWKQTRKLSIPSRKREAEEEATGYLMDATQRPFSSLRCKNGEGERELPVRYTREEEGYGCVF